MLLGIFDIFHVEEFHGHITDWWAVIVTAILSGGVAFFAAWLQINNQVKHETIKQRERNQKILKYLTYQIEESIKEIKQIIKGIEDSKVPVEIVNEPPYESRQHFSCAPIERLNELEPNKIFDVLIEEELLNKEMSEGLTKFTNSTRQIIQSINFLNKDLTKVYEERFSYIKQINNLNQDFIKQLDYKKVNENQNSFFKQGSEIDRYIKKVMGEMRIKKIKNRLFGLKKVNDFVFSKTFKGAGDEVDIELIHEHVIPMQHLFLSIKYKNKSQNRNLEIREKELKGYRGQLESFLEKLK